MAIQGCWLLLAILVLVNSYACAKLVAASHETSSFNRSSFPACFIFGTSSSAYQVEQKKAVGAQVIGITSLTNIQVDLLKGKILDRILGQSNGDVAVDFYHRYKEDVQLMKEMGMDAFRFSISWSRLLPRGNLRGGVNKEGIEFYNNLINELLSNGIQPFVTIFHFDLPQALEDEYGGLLSPRIVADFRDFAEICYKEFGDRVKHWITINEPWAISIAGYTGQGSASFPPARCSSWEHPKCLGGDSATEPYVVTHHLLLSHAAAVKVYKEKYQACQKGKIGITLNSVWMVPYSNTKADGEATKRALDFMLGWFMDPLTYGDYPQTMRTHVRQRLPKFTKEQSMMVKGSFDFIGINYYTAIYVLNAPVSNTVNISYSTDSLTNITKERNGIPIGSSDGATFILSHPSGLRDLLIYTKEKYNNPTIYITENGVDEGNNATLPLKEGLKDTTRIDYHHQHILSLRRAINDGVDVKGYFAWSLLDNFEWTTGYTSRFGINFVDYRDGLKRYPKDSAFWFKKFLQK